MSRFKSFFIEHRLLLFYHFSFRLWYHFLHYMRTLDFGTYFLNKIGKYLKIDYMLDIENHKEKDCQYLGINASSTNDWVICIITILVK